MSSCWPCASRLRSIGWRSWLAAAVLLTTVELVAWCVCCLRSGILCARSGWCSAAAAAALADVVSVGAGGDGLHVRRTPVMADRLAAYPDRTTPRIIGPDVAGDGRHWRHVAAPDGSQGYLPAELVDAEP